MGKSMAAHDFRINVSRFCRVRHAHLGPINSNFNIGAHGAPYIRLPCNYKKHNEINKDMAKSKGAHDLCKMFPDFVGCAVRTWGQLISI